MALWNKRYYAANPERAKAKVIAWQKNNPVKKRASRRRIKFGLSFDDVLAMLSAQNFECSICTVKIDEASAHVDHCHTTGKVRGLLCGFCNSVLGFSKDRPAVLRKAAEYLEKNLQS